MKDHHIEVEGCIQTVLPGTMFRVELDNKHQVLATISGVPSDERLMVVVPGYEADTPPALSQSVVWCSKQVQLHRYHNRVTSQRSSERQNVNLPVDDFRVEACTVPMPIEPVDGKPPHLVVSQSPGRETQLAGIRIAADFYNGINERVDCDL